MPGSDGGTPGRVWLAIGAARAAGPRLILAAKCNEPGERAWFETVIRPQVETGVEWVGEADGPTKKELLARPAV